jgi:hypothetical protein
MVKEMTKVELHNWALSELARLKKACEQERYGANSPIILAGYIAKIEVWTQIRDKLKKGVKREASRRSTGRQDVRPRLQERV